VGSARISFTMRSRVYLLKTLTKSFSKNILAIVSHFMFIKVIMFMFILSLNDFISAER
jgi:hypothetical protein